MAISMIAAAIPLLVAAFAWWISTGFVLWLVGRPAATFKVSAWAAAFAMAGATIAVLHLRGNVTGAGAYGGFLAGLILWAWHEIMFLLGFVSGPRKTACPDGLSLWQRFIVSTQTIIHHEVAIAVHALVIAILSWGAANKTALWTFLLLWGMRLSAKFVVFFGAPNLSADFLPRHLTYLTSYFSTRTASSFFPVAIVGATSVAAFLIWLASAAMPGTYAAVSWTLLASLAVLAVIEHWALVIPLPDAALWRWAVPNTTGVRPLHMTETRPQTGAKAKNNKL
ncbi:MAG: putative photosynthetic complex assembly protein PuhE [Pseudomonadota bacterium]